MAFFYVPIGVVRRGFFPGEKQAVIPEFNGGDMQAVHETEIPVGSHSLELTPTLEPLEKMKHKVTSDHRARPNVSEWYGRSCTMCLLFLE